MLLGPNNFIKRRDEKMSKGWIVRLNWKTNRAREGFRSVREADDWPTPFVTKPPPRSRILRPDFDERGIVSALRNHFSPREFLPLNYSSPCFCRHRRFLHDSWLDNCRRMFADSSLLRILSRKQVSTGADASKAMYFLGLILQDLDCLLAM